jgi:hypothetical protein
MPRFEKNCRTCINWENGHGNNICIGCTEEDKQNYVSALKAPQQALDKQEGGQHYKDKAIQPIVYIHANKLGFCEGNVVKYITRHKEKNGAEDIRKVIHYCELLLELEYKNE